MLLSASGKPWAANPKSGALGADALIAVPPIISAPSLAPGAKAVRPTIGQRHFLIMEHADATLIFDIFSMTYFCSSAHATFQVSIMERANASPISGILDDFPLSVSAHATSRVVL